MHVLAASLRAALAPARPAEILSELIRRRSRNGLDGEAAVAAYLAGHLRDLGLEVELPEVLPGRPNLIARLRGGGGPSLVFNTHMDTVPHGAGWEHDPFAAEVVDGNVYGLGAVDAKGPLAAFVSAIEALVSSPARLRGDLILAAVVDEEASSSGARALVQGLRADCALVGEPTGLRVATAHRGSFRPVVVVRGRTAHSSRPEEGVNAAFQALPVLEALRAYAGAVVGAHPLCGAPTATVTMLAAGVKENVIPDRCEITIDRRLIPGETDATAEAEIEAVLAETMLRTPGLQVAIESRLPTTGPPSELDRAHPLVSAARGAAELVGDSGELIGLSGACDMTHFIGAGIPALVMGPGDGSLAHRPDEHMDLGELHRGALAYALVAAAICGVEDAA